MAVLDLLGRRWVLRILWYLKDGEKRTTRAIQQACEISSPNVLSSRLKELKNAGVVKLEDKGGYCVTEKGRALLSAMRPLAVWADQWAKDVGKEDMMCFTQSEKGK
jgi:DNA-binding HxlR family transcriptional regulator